MASLSSRLDLFAIGRSFVLARAKKIDPTQIDIQGSDVNIIVGGASYIAYEVVLQLAQKLNALTLDGAEKDDLDRYAWDRYQVTRKGASSAVGTVRTFRATTTAGAGAVAIGTVILSLTGIPYKTTTEAVYAAGSTEVTAEVTSQRAGKSQQVGSNQLRRFQTPTLLFDPSIQVTNDVATAGGEDEESDDVFRERIRDFWLAARRGTGPAIEFGARTVAGIESAAAQEALTPSLAPARVVNLYVADGSGIANASLGQEVLNVLQDYRACGIQVVITPSTPQIVDVKLQLSFAAGADTNLLAQSVRAAIITFINSLGVNATLHRGDLFGVLRRYVPSGLIPADASIVTPAGDLVPANGSTLRTTSANVLLA